MKAHACILLLMALALSVGLVPPAFAGNIYYSATINVVDSDGDGVPDMVDNAQFTANPSQVDTDNDGVGDARDPFPSGQLDVDGDGVNDEGDANYANASVWTFYPVMNGPPFVADGNPLSIPLTIAGGSGGGFATGSIGSGIPDYLLLELRVDDIALAGSPAAYWIGGYTETSLNLSTADLAALGLNSGTHQFTATSRLLTYGADSSTIQISVISSGSPEPSSLLLLGGSVLLVKARRRKERWNPLAT